MVGEFLEQALVGGVAILYLVYRLVMLLIHVKMPNEMIALGAPDAIQLPAIKPGMAGEMVAWGSTKAVGADLFGPGIFPFEAISILLLVAVVGAIAIARPLDPAGRSESGPLHSGDDQQTVGDDPNARSHGGAA